MKLDNHKNGLFWPADTLFNFIISIGITEYEREQAPQHCPQFLYYR